MEDLTQTAGGYHWRDGWFFRRLPDGSVKILKFADARPTAALVLTATIPPSEWASIVASVSAFGETGASFRVFEAAHIG